MPRIITTTSILVVSLLIGLAHASAPGPKTTPPAFNSSEGNRVADEIVSSLSLGERPTHSNGLIAFSDAPDLPAGPKTWQAGPKTWQKAHLFTIAVDGKGRKPLTSGTGGYIAPAFSPDGLKIACTRIVDNQMEIWLMGSDGSHAKRITAGMMPVWSPDGQRLAFFTWTEKGRHVYTVKVDGSDLVQLTKTGHNQLPSWSPDGKQLVFWSGNKEGFGQIWVMNADGSGSKQLTFPEKNDYTPKGSSANAPVWSADGKIAYWSGIEHKYGQIWVMDGDGKNNKQLTKAPAPKTCDNPAWSPDGKTILFDTNQRGNIEIWAVEADGTNARLVISQLRVVPGRSAWQPIPKSK